MHDMHRRNSKMSNNMNVPNFAHGWRDSGASGIGGLNRMNSIMSGRGALRDHRINSIASNKAKK